jgi:hypothetical protein
MGKMRLLFIDSYLSYRDDALKDRFDCIINIRIKATFFLSFWLEEGIVDLLNICHFLFELNNGHTVAKYMAI